MTSVQNDTTQRDELAQIKARFDEASTARRDSNDTVADIQALLLAEQSSHDVPKLLAALEAVQELHRKMPVYATFAGDCEHGEDCDSVEIGGESMCPAETEGYTCDECAELSSEELPEYPCATIRAIAEATK